jgi:hypothetical protein
LHCAYVRDKSRTYRSNEFFRSLQSPTYSVGLIGPAKAVPLLQSPLVEIFRSL